MLVNRSNSAKSLFRRICLVVVACGVLMGMGTACTPEEISWYLNEATPEQQAAVTSALQERQNQYEIGLQEIQLHPFLVCVRHHESDKTNYPYTNGYGAKNSRSSASGAYQFLDSTWRSASAVAGYPGYPSARSAPWYVQDAVAYNTAIVNGGRSHWNGSGC